MLFQPTSAADMELFVDLLDSEVALNALPTTAIHMGVYVDWSIGPNWILTSGNGAA